MTTTVIVAADLHTNCKVALCPPATELDDGGTYRLSRSQRWLWDCWQDFLQKVEAIKKDKILILNGDIADADIKDRSFQIISRNPATIKKNAVRLIDPLAQLCKVRYITRGTPAHSGQSGYFEELIAEDISARQNKETKAWSWYQLLLVIDGVRIDIAHHGPTGGMPWTRHNREQALAARTLFKYAEQKERAPDIVIRSHGHKKGDSWNSYPVRALLTPAWTLATEHSLRVADNDIADIGSYVIYCDNGKYEVQEISYEVGRRIWINPLQQSKS